MPIVPNLTSLEVGCVDSLPMSKGTNTNFYDYEGTMKSTVKLAAVFVLSTVLGTSAYAEETKLEYHTTPPKDYSVETQPKLDTKVTSNIEPIINHNQVPTLNPGVQLLPAAEEEVVAPAESPFSCPTLEPIREDGYNPNSLRINQKQIVVNFIDDTRKLSFVSLKSFADSESRELVNWSVVLYDDKACPYYLDQSDQTAALRLLETLQSASFDPNQTITIELLDCYSNEGNRSCSARFRSLDWNPR